MAVLKTEMTVDSFVFPERGVNQFFMVPVTKPLGFSGGSVVKNSPANARDRGLIPGYGRSPGEENGNPLQYSCLEKSHTQRSLVGYSPWGCKRTRHDLVTK